MTVIASFVVGSNGASSLNGSSQGLSTPADRDRFLKRHQSAAAFIIGKNSAAIESYSKSNVPIFIFTRHTAKLEVPHQMMQQIRVDRDLLEISKLIDLRIPGDIVVEAGSTLLMALVEAGAIDFLELTLSPIAGDGDFIDVAELISHFEVIEDIDIDGTRLLQCRDKSYATNG